MCYNISVIRIKTRTGKKDRVRTYPIEEVLPYFRVGHNKNSFIRNYGGYKVRMKSRKYLVFYLKGTKCACCGLEGTYFALEGHCNCPRKKKFHFTLYGINGNGKEVPLTVDHIKPRCKNGGNGFKNSQILCANCNNEKGNKKWSRISYLWNRPKMCKINGYNNFMYYVIKPLLITFKIVFIFKVRILNRVFN